MIAWRQVLGFIPVPVVYTDNLPLDVSGCVARYAPVVLIRRRYRGDEGLHQHQLEHVRQYWACFITMAAVTVLFVLAIAPMFGRSMPQPSVIIALFLSWLGHTILRELSRSYRAVSEIRAYREQMKYFDRKGDRLTLEQAAARLAGARYNLKIGIEEAHRLLG